MIHVGMKLKEVLGLTEESKDNLVQIKETIFEKQLLKIAESATAVPITREKVLAGLVYMIKSFAYKAVNFTEDAKLTNLLI